MERIESPEAASAQRRIRELFASVGATASLHIREIDGVRELEVDADEPVAVASVIKIAVAVAFARQITDGTLDATTPVEVPASLRVGGIGTAGCLDPVTMSLRDLALFMMSMSDNAATDVVLDHVGPSAVQDVIDDLGLHQTVMVGGMDALHQQVARELSLHGTRDLDAQVTAAGDRVKDIAWIDPLRTNRSTARDITALLEAVWTDRAASAAGCAEVRRLLGHQVTAHRLASAFDDPIEVASKTGTLPTIRNEAGVITYPDHQRYVVAVFTRAQTLHDRRPDIDAAIGRSARIGIQTLRGSDG